MIGLALILRYDLTYQAVYCPIPRVAYETNKTLSAAEHRRLQGYGRCMCGSGDIDYDVYRLENEARDRFHPSCGDNSSRWNPKLRAHHTRKD